MIGITKPFAYFSMTYFVTYDVHLQGSVTTSHFFTRQARQVQIKVYRSQPKKKRKRNQCEKPSVRLRVRRW